jgi:DNA-binding GntR family transcriptional regulator
VSGPLEPLAAPQTLAAHTRRAVLAAIGDGRLEQGGRYSVAQLAEQLGISRTPVREALLVLEREGRVRFERNKGVRVLETTAADVAEVFELRLLLEVPAAAKACGVVDTADLRAAVEAHDGERFHELIVLAAGNRRLAAIVAGLREALAGPAGRDAQEALAEHRAILAAIEAGDADRAAAAMRYHLRRGAELAGARSIRA